MKYESSYKFIKGYLKEQLLHSFVMIWISINSMAIGGYSSTIFENRISAVRTETNSVRTTEIHLYVLNKLFPL